VLKKLRFLTAGESHGPGLTGILEGLPAGLELTAAMIEQQLRRRRQVGGRGARMSIEQDRVEITGGIRQGFTIGSPVALLISNRDHDNWSTVMSVVAADEKAAEMTIPRPGHIDLAGCLKYDTEDTRNVSERASARETAMRTAIGACCRRLLKELGIAVGSRVLQAGDIRDLNEYDRLTPMEINVQADGSEMRCLDPLVSGMMADAVEKAREEGDTLGGMLEVRAAGLPVGLGSSSQWDLKLQARLAAALMSLGGMKGFEVGAGISVAELRGSEANDGIVPVDRGVSRLTNHAGGIEGGLSNGSDIILRLAMKPIPSLRQTQQSVDLKTGSPAQAPQERGDTWGVAAASIVAEAMTCLVLADALLEKFGGDTLQQLKGHIQSSGRWLAGRDNRSHV